MPTRMWTCLWSRGDTCAVRGKWGWQDHAHEHFVLAFYQADKGEICFKGEHVEFKSPGEAIARGIGMVHQHFSLVKKNDGAGQCDAGSERAGNRGGPEVGKGKADGPSRDLRSFKVKPGSACPHPLRGRAAEGGDSKGPVPGCKPVDSGRAYRRAHPQETERILRGFETACGMRVWNHYHHPPAGEITDISDRVTVLRDGRKVSSLVTEETTPEELSASMIGRELKAGREIRESAAGDIALSLKDVCLHKKHSTKMSLDHVSLTIRRGEILGIAGVGRQRTEGTGRGNNRNPQDKQRTDGIPGKGYTQRQRESTVSGRYLLYFRRPPRRQPCHGHDSGRQSDFKGL